MTATRYSPITCIRARTAKKGVYSVLLDIGEQEGWTTCHTSAGRLITPYENELVIMHEGASGGGKSEMLQDIAREPDGEVLLSTNTVTGEKTYLHIGSTCKIEPVCDDMATCYPGVQNNSGKLVLVDGEDGWFLRMDGVTHYGCDPVYERICTEPKEPLCFFNMEGHPGATLLIWEHTLDSNGKPCSNPRAIVPRWDVPNIVKEPVEVDVRSFGVRMPPSTRDNPNYGIMGMLHIIPPALAWLWRLIAPRGFNNPSIVTGNELKSEGVGSYWPFATGKRVKQANLLLHQIVDSPNTRYVLIPNQHIGVYKVGFAAEWISREYLARHGGAKIRREHLEPARCPLLGYAMKDLTIDGQKIRSKFLRVDTQRPRRHRRLRCRRKDPDRLLPQGAGEVRYAGAGAARQADHRLLHERRHAGGLREDHSDRPLIKRKRKSPKQIVSVIFLFSARNRRGTRTAKILPQNS